MAELERVLFIDELEISGDKNKHATSRTRKLVINGGDEMLALLERKSNKFSNDILGSY
jgi:mediator of RNA polymerase II transcription subunit 10